MALSAQDIFVGFIALVAGVFVVRRVMDAARPEGEDASCDHCAAGPADSEPGSR